MTTQLGLLAVAGAPGKTTLIDMPTPELLEGGVLFRVDHLAVTANTVTYAAVAKALPYLELFPHRPDPDARTGLLPAWGHATAIESRHEAVPVGSTFYGVWPATSTCALVPHAATPTGIVVARPQVPRWMGFYGLYHRTDIDPFHLPDRIHVAAALRPLLLTGLLLADYLIERDQFGARNVVLTSASSKTAFGLATALRGEGVIDVVGLTAASRRETVRTWGLHDRVVSYDTLEELATLESVVVVDFAGDLTLADRLHGVLGDRLRHTIVVGTTHFDGAGYAGARAGSSEVFFAPGWAHTRQSALGNVFAARLLSGWRFQMAGAPRVFPAELRRGMPALRDTYFEILEGRAAADRSLVVQLP